MQKWNESQPLMNSNWSNYPNDDNGWFLITTDSNITEKVNGEVDKGIWSAGREYETNKENSVENIIIPSNKRQAWKPFSNPLYSYDFDYKNSQGDQITETCKINLGNIDGYSTDLDNGNSIFRIDLLLPTIMVTFLSSLKFIVCSTSPNRRIFLRESDLSLIYIYFLSRKYNKLLQSIFILLPIN